jgi:hypothetical protein
LVIDPFWAGELSFGIYYRQKRTHSKQARSKLSTQRVSRRSPFSCCRTFPIERTALWHTYRSALARPFCSICGSTLFATNETGPARAGIILAGIGTLDGEKSFKPEHEFYCKMRFNFLPELQGTTKSRTL